jgi:glycosyltransferase involved in cell wall biosynthesis
VFVHMNQIYIILGGLVWKLLGKKISFWYAHGHVPFGLRIAEKIVDILFTSTKSGCRLVSNKIKVVNQGIDVNWFVSHDKNKNDDVFRIVTVGRISPTKDYETLINAIDELKSTYSQLQVYIIGQAGLGDQEVYFQKLKTILVDKGLGNTIHFVGAVPNSDIVTHLQKSDLFVNMSYTGSLDKAILEAMSCGLPILTCNEALLEVLGDYTETLMYPKGDYTALANKMSLMIKMDLGKRKQIGKELRTIVVKNHSIDKLVKKIIGFLT